MTESRVISTLLDRPIAFHRPFLRLGMGIKAALLLSQCVYWSRRTQDGSGWFYKTQAEWEEETGLTRREQESARMLLKDLGFLHERKAGVPCQLFFRLGEEELWNALMELADNDGQYRHACMAKTAATVCTKPPPQSAQKRHSSTEITTETTTETTHRDCADKPRSPKRATQLPDDFEPNETNQRIAQEHGVKISDELPQFCDYHRAKGSTMKDWHAALNTWLRNASKFSQRSANSEASRSNRRETPLEAGVRELEEMRERIANGNILEWLNQSGPVPFG